MLSLRRECELFRKYSTFFNKFQQFEIKKFDLLVLEDYCEEKKFRLWVGETAGAHIAEIRNHDSLLRVILDDEFCFACQPKRGQITKGGWLHYRWELIGASGDTEILQELLVSLEIGGEYTELLT